MPPTTPGQTLPRALLTSAALMLTASTLHPGKDCPPLKEEEQLPHAGHTQGPCRPSPTSPSCSFAACDVSLLLPLKLQEWRPTLSPKSHSSRVAQPLLPAAQSVPLTPPGSDQPSGAPEGRLFSPATPSDSHRTCPFLHGSSGLRVSVHGFSRLLGEVTLSLTGHGTPVQSILALNSHTPISCLTKFAFPQWFSSAHKNMS